MHTRIGINPFGRIGRAMFRALISRAPTSEWVGINDVMDIEMLAHLLRHDSVYGPFQGNVEVLEGAIRVDDREIPVFAETDPAALPSATSAPRSSSSPPDCSATAPERPSTSRRARRR